MKKGMILLLGGILILSLIETGHAVDIKVKVIIDNTNVRLKPDLTSQIIAQIALGTILQSEGKSGVWYKVNLPPDEKGFVVSGYIHQSLVEEVSERVEEVQKVREEKPPAIPRVQEEMPRAVPPPIPDVYAPSGVGIGPKSGVGIRGGYTMPSEGKYGGGLKYGANLCLGISKNIGIEISGLRFQSNVDQDPEELSKGKLSVIPIQLSLQIRFPVSGQFIPYVHGGGGYYLNSFNLDSEISDAWETRGFDIEEKVENVMGFHFGAGLDYFFTDNVAFSADFRYCIAKADGSWTITDQIGEATAQGDFKDLNLGTIMFGGGLKFFF